MQILKHLESLRAREHDATVALIEGLVECHRTRAHVDAGYRSVFQLLVERLRYSPAAASRRFAAMRCAMRCPFVIEMLRGHRTSLTALAKVASSLESCPDPDALLRSIDGLAPDDVDAVVAGLRPVPKPAERVRPITIAPPARNNGSELGMHWGSSASEDKEARFASAPRTCVRGSAETSEAVQAARPATDDDAPTSPAEPTPAEARVAVSFTMTREDFDALQAARTRLSRTRPKPLTLEETVRALVTFHDEHRPKPRRRSTPPTVRHTRHIPRATREAVFARDGHRCAFVGPDGTRCTATHDLQIDHVEPYCEGGTNVVANLRVLCGTHNRRVAEFV
mgnify:CR=1 FL=1